MAPRYEHDVIDLIGFGFLVVLDELRTLSRDVHRIERKLDRIIELETIEMTDLSRIAGEVEENTSAVGSAVALIASLAEEIRNAGTDAEALAALADTLDANSTRLAEAVAANTPAAAPADLGPTDEGTAVPTPDDV